MKISVVIATYNYGRFIEEAVDSVLAQDWPAGDLELIVVDDGSTDDTRERLTRYGRALKYIHQENSGQAAAFNAGFGAATGEIVCLLDADDAWKPSKLRLTAGAFAEAADVGMVQHFMMDVAPDGSAMRQRLDKRKDYYVLDDLLSGEASFTGTSGLAFRRSALDRVLPVPPELFYCADEYLYTTVLFHARVRSINEVLGYKKIHGANWFAGTINDTRRLGNYIKVKTVIIGEIEKRLVAAGRDASAGVLPLRLELARTKALYYSRIGEKRRALDVIRDEVLPAKASRRRWFIAATLSIGVVSPALYARLYAFYARSRS